MRSVKTALACCLAISSSPVLALGDFQPYHYAKALWMATRFLGAQRSGIGPNWLLQDQASGWDKSFVKDKYLVEGDIEGGWFDCGDHVMFGQTQFYSSYLLAKAYASFPLGWRDYYHGDYSDYKASQDYSIAGGTGNGLPDLLEELRYEADFLVKITPNSSYFISQKGDGNADHKFWITAGIMADRNTVLNGGESDGSRPIVLNPTDGSMPALAAATLAVMAQVDPDPVRKATYLQHAKYAYLYSLMHTTTVGALGFYNANKNTEDAKTNAAWELYKATGDVAYKTAAESHFTTVEINYSWILDYENDEWLAAYNGFHEMGVAAIEGGASRNFLNALSTKRQRPSATQNNVETSYSGRFRLRGPAGFAFLHALAAQAAGTSEFDQYIVDQVDYILGSNTSNQSYLIGFDENNAKQVTLPHHRNVYLNNSGSKRPETMESIPARNKYLGAMVGGSIDGTYLPDILNLSTSEPCLDLNAPLIGALGYIVSRVAPSNQTIPVRPVSKHLDPTFQLEGLQLKVPRESSAAQVLSLQGKVLATVQPGTSWFAPSAGIYLLRQGERSLRLALTP